MEGEKKANNPKTIAKQNQACLLKSLMLGLV